MKFEKRNFMGIELDVLVGHPEHDLLFVATQVARAAGLKQPANSASAFRRVHKAGQALMTLIQDGAPCHASCRGTTAHNVDWSRA